MSNRTIFVVSTSLVVIVLAALVASGAIISPARPVLAGGWAVVTLDDLPEHVIAGEPFTVRFTVRQHGVSVLEGLAPRVILAPESGADPFEIAATEETPGHYTALLTIPDPGGWTWSVNAFGPEQPMPALDVLPARTAGEQIAYGTALFVAKGCAVCHAHTGITGDTFASNNVGPTLTNYTGDPGFLRNWLRDPSAIEPGTVMPTLGLNDGEIEALIAFLLAG